MAFVHTILEAIHAQDTSGIYCTIPAINKREFVTWLSKYPQKCIIWGWRPAILVTVAGCIQNKLHAELSWTLFQHKHPQCKLEEHMNFISILCWYRFTVISCILYWLQYHRICFRQQQTHTCAIIYHMYLFSVSLSANFNKKLVFI